MKTTATSRNASRKTSTPSRGKKPAGAKSATNSTRSRKARSARKPNGGIEDRLLSLKEKATGWVPAHPGLAASLAAGVGAVTGALIFRKR